MKIVKKRRVLIITSIGILIICAFVIFLVGRFLHRGHLEHMGRPAQSQQPDIIYYTCGMHPDVRVSPEEYNKGNVNCPICNMKLTPVYKEGVEEEKVYYGCGVNTEGKCPHCDLGKPDARCICGEHSFMIKGQKINCQVCDKPLRALTQEEVDRLKGVVSRVRIKGEQTRLAGVKTEPVRRLHLYKEIRTVGKVAYDPELAVAQEEFISSLKALDKIQEGEISEIKERAENLVGSSKRKLMLLGLSQKQIKELEEKREVQTSLILPEKKMWIYGDVYEYELSWVKVGEGIKVTISSLPGKEFNGIISSINPVLDPKTRSVRFRAEVDNPNLELKPEMYVDIFIRYDFPTKSEKTIYQCPMKCHISDKPGECPVCGMKMTEKVLPEGLLAIPKSAVLDTGLRKIVYVEESPGTYTGRIVKLEPEATSTIDGGEAKFYPVLKGVSEGELVVTRANFLIDSQSQISGVAAAAYGGALGVEEKKTPPVHQH